MATVSEALTQARALVTTLEAIDAAQNIATDVASRPTPLQTPTLEYGSAPIAWGAKVSPVFRDRVRWIALDLDIGPAPGKPEPSWPMAWMAFETDRTFSPTIKNPNSSGTGLIQFMNDTAINDLKTTLAHLRSLSAEDQLNWVWKYLRNRIKERGPIRQASDGYLAILMPAYMDDPDSAVIWRKGDKAFAPNGGLDKNKDGEITKAEVAAKIYAILAEGLLPDNIG